MTISVVMPAWNEAEGIADFIQEISRALAEWPHRFIVVDDCSSDGTAEVVRKLGDQGIDSSVVINSRNQGHGPSTITALRLGLDAGTRSVIAVDGDGQFRGSDIGRVFQALLEQDADVVEGIRRDRNDPMFRQVVSALTRIMVWTRVRRWPADANTPLRAYTAPALARLIASVPEDAVTPNLLISAMCRAGGLTVIELPVASISRRGANDVGNTWGTRRKAIPSKRFLTFCGKAAIEWVRTPMRDRFGNVGPERADRG